MAVAKQKHLYYVRSRSRAERPRRNDGPSFAHLRIRPGEAPRARSVIGASPVEFRSTFSTAAQFAGVAGETLLAIAAWLVSEMLAGCAAYALAMNGIPRTVLDEDARPSTPPDPSGDPQGPILHLISRDIRMGEPVVPADVKPCAIAQLAARSEYAAGAHWNWCMPIIAPAVLLLAKIRKGAARRRAILELRSMDDRSLRDIGISRSDIGHVVRYGARPE